MATRTKPSGSFGSDLGQLTLRLTAGGLLAGHGAQKLFGKFGGYGLEGTAGWLESLGMKPGKQWATLAGASEFGGGVLTALGLLHPVGPITSLAPMAMASLTVHKGKPIWVTSGGPELPVAFMAIASALTVAGPGRISLDRLLGIRLPWWMSVVMLLGTAAGVAYGVSSQQSQGGDEGTGGDESANAGRNPGASTGDATAS